VDVHRFKIFKKLKINKSIQLVQFVTDNQHLFYA
jgi:DNA-binding NarL/FixJ family response regulator